MLGNVIHTVQKVIKREDPAMSTEWLDTLHGMTELESLIAIKDQLSQIDFLDFKHAKKKIDLVLELDESAYRKVKRVTHNYLIKLNKNKVMKDDIQVVTYEYQRQLYSAYSQILDAYKAQKKTKLNPGKINLLLARYLNATFMMSKWRYFDDRSAAFGAWDNVHKIINIAEDLAIMNKNLFLYNFQIKETSIASILKRGFMLDTLHKGNYTPLEIELTDRVLKIWATNPLIVNTYKENRYHFFIQLENGKGPDRLRLHEKFANCRYWKTTRLIDLMEAYLCAVDMQKSLREFGLEKIAPTSVVVKLFKKLRIDWCAEGYKRQRRSENRTKKHTLLNVSHGVHSIHRRLASMQAQQEEDGDEEGGFTFNLKVATHEPEETKSSQFQNVLGSENWWMVDESANGFGVDFEEEPTDWIAIGALIGYSEMGYKNTLNIAEVKSVRKLDNGKYRVGLRKISHNTTPVHVSIMEKASFSQPVSGYYLDDGQENIKYSDEFTALLVDNDAENNPKLLIPRKRFKRGATFIINIDGEEHPVVAGKVVGKHNGWILFEALV